MARHCLVDKRMIENAPASLRVCVWYRYKIEHLAEAGRGQGRRKTWVVVEQGTSDSLFHLTDTSGSCAVDPDGATVHTTRTGLEARPISAAAGVRH